MRQREEKKKNIKTITKKKGTQKETKKEKKETPARVPSVLPGVFFRNGEREAGWFASLLLLRGGGSFAHFLSKQLIVFEREKD
jgi:isopentenyl phosphate kinase